MDNSKRLRVLIAEDNDADMFMIRSALEASGVAVDIESAPDGRRALALIALSEEAPARKFDGMILDRSLVGHNALEILTKVRGNPLLAQTPVVILTSFGSPADRQQAESLGISAFLLKPLGFDAYMEIGKQIAELFLSAGSSISSNECEKRE